MYNLMEKPKFQYFRRKGPIVKPGRIHNEDWNRMAWATFKTYMLFFIVVTVGLFIANLLYYKHKWWVCRQPPHKIHYLLEDECLKVVQLGKEILPSMFHKRSIFPLIHHLVLVGTFCVVALLGNYINDYHTSHYAAHGLAATWVYDHYRNHRLIFNSNSLLYNLGHTTHFLAFATSYAFTATIMDNIHRRMEYPKVKKRRNGNDRVRLINQS